MSSSDLPSRSDRPHRGRGSACDIDDLTARAQWLADAVHPWDGYPLEWHVEAWLIGDLSALAAVALLQSKDESPPGADEGEDEFPRGAGEDE